MKSNASTKGLFELVSKLPTVSLLDLHVYLVLNEIVQVKYTTITENISKIMGIIKYSTEGKHFYCKRLIIKNSIFIIVLLYFVRPVMSVLFVFCIADNMITPLTWIITYVYITNNALKLCSESHKRLFHFLNVKHAICIYYKNGRASKHFFHIFLLLLLLLLLIMTMNGEHRHPIVKRLRFAVLAFFKRNVLKIIFWHRMLLFNFKSDRVTKKVVLFNLYRCRWL